MTPEVSADQVVLITRIFDAPREQVFKAWTDPDEVAAWYGPAHMEVPRNSVRIDARVGGRWEVTMVPRGGGGDGFAIGYEILELVEPDLLVMRSDPMPGHPDGTVVRVQLDDHGPKTRMALSDGPYRAGAGHAEAGYEAAFDKLATQLADNGSDDLPACGGER